MSQLRMHDGTGGEAILAETPLRMGANAACHLLVLVHQKGIRLDRVHIVYLVVQRDPGVSIFDGLTLSERPDLRQRYILLHRLRILAVAALSQAQAQSAQKNSRHCFFVKDCWIRWRIESVLAADSECLSLDGQTCCCSTAAIIPSSGSVIPKCP